MEGIIQEISREASVEEVGFHISPPGDVMYRDEGEVKWQDSYAKLFFRYSFNLVANRMAAELWRLLGWIAQTVFFDENSPAVRKAILDLKRSFEDFLKFEEHTDARRAGFKAIVKRSAFATPHLQQVIAMFQAAKWRLTSDIRDWCACRWKVLFHSQIIEDGFQREKVAARRQQVHRQGREILGYRSLVQSDLLKMHKLATSEPRSEDIGRSETLAEHWTKPQVSKASIPFPGLVGYNSSPTWYSPQGPRVHLAYADIPMMRFVVENQCYDKVRHFWLGGMLHFSHMIIVRSMPGSAGPQIDWALPLQHCADSGVLVWSVSIRKIGKVEVAEPRLGLTQPQWIFVSSLADWQDRRTEAKPPLGQLALSQETFQGLPQVVRIAVIGKPTTLLGAGAAQAFWKLSATYLRKIASLVGVSLQAGASAFSILFDLVSYALSLDEKETLDILAQRFGETTGDGADYGLNDILELDDAAACLDQNDRGDLQQAQKQWSRRTRSTRPLSRSGRRGARLYRPANRPRSARGGRQVPRTAAVGGVAAAPLRRSFCRHARSSRSL